MDASQRGSLFFKLFPLEIRRKIYEEYADDYLRNIKPIDLAQNDNRTHFRAGSRVSPYPPLLLACKRLAREARPVLQQYVCCISFTRDDPFIEHTLLYAAGNFQPSLVRKLRLELCHRFGYPGDPVNHRRQQDLDIFFPGRAKIPATEKVKVSKFYHREWLQFLKQELPGVTVEGDGWEWEEGLDLEQDDRAWAYDWRYDWNYDWSNDMDFGTDEGWGIDSGSQDADMAIERDHADVYLQDNEYDDDSDENTDDDDSRDGGDGETMDWEP
ncbi:hypothetical protein DL765_011160 [Monosporascus sp. GIB2]|nr:hypothetical protein DL765_011160 [Monosporascus sp. GIB2]